MKPEEKYKRYVQLANYSTRLSKRIQTMQLRLIKAEKEMKEIENSAN